MGFLGLFKSKEDKSQLDFPSKDELEVPPPPPTMDSDSGLQSDIELPELPQPGEEQELNIEEPLPEMPEAPKEEVKPSYYSKVEEPEQEASVPIMQPDVPEMPSAVEEQPEKVQYYSKTEQPETSNVGFELPDLSIGKPEFHPEAPEDPIESTEDYLKTYKNTVVLEPNKPLFVRVETFEALLAELNSTRSAIRASESHLKKVVEFRDVEQKSYLDFHKQVADIQRKLTTVDSMLFKG